MRNGSIALVEETKGGLFASVMVCDEFSCDEVLFLVIFVFGLFVGCRSISLKTEIIAIFLRRRKFLTVITLLSCEHLTFTFNV